MGLLEMWSRFGDEIEVISNEFVNEWMMEGKMTVSYEDQSVH